MPPPRKVGDRRAANWSRCSKNSRKIPNSFVFSRWPTWASGTKPTHWPWLSGRWLRTRSRGMSLTVRLRSRSSLEWQRKPASPTAPSPLYRNYSRHPTLAHSPLRHSLLRCSGSIQCSIRSGMIRAFKNSPPRPRRNRKGVSHRTRMTPEEQNKALDAWEISARHWDKHRALIAQMFAPLTSGLVKEARIGMGQKVLDIGGGSGEPSFTISGIVGPTGSVMYTDPVAGMVETAQAEAGRRGLTNIEFRKCSADALPFPDSTFDVVVSRLSAMFFVDPVTAVREALRVILEDGCVSFAVWGPKEANPF